MDPGAYCRHVEAYLCTRNQGHLIRIVGPAFELVSGWSASGVPLSVVRRAVDRACARQQARGGRRRPIRIQFCEADVLDLFDDWRRAVGVGLTAPAPDADAPAGEKGAAGSVRRRSSLASHLERVAALLDAWTGSAGSEALARSVAAAAAELDLVRPAAEPRDARTRSEAAAGPGQAANGAAARRPAAVRGKARQRLVERLRELDRALLEAARESAGASLRQRFRDDAARELAPFRERMERDAFRRAVEAGADRLLIDHFDLPRLAWD